MGLIKDDTEGSEIACQAPKFRTRFARGSRSPRKVRGSGKVALRFNGISNHASYPMTRTEMTWRCLYCHHGIKEGEQCPMPTCVEARLRARQRMGMSPRAAAGAPPKGR